MKIPSCFYGKITDVKKECRKVAKKLIAGASFKEAVEGYELLDTDDYPEARLFPDFIPQLLCETDSFHFPYLYQIIENLFWKKYDDDRKSMEEHLERIFNQVKDDEVGLLCFSVANSGFFGTPSVTSIAYCDNRKRWKPYLQNILKFWNIYKTIETRFKSTNSYKLFNEIGVFSYMIANVGLYTCNNKYIGNDLDFMSIEDFYKKYKILDFDVNLLPLREW